MSLCVRCLSGVLVLTCGRCNCRPSLGMGCLDGVWSSCMLKRPESAAWAARAFASFLFRPDPWKTCESTVTAITKFLAWLSPLSDTNSYLRPGRNSFRIITAFFPWPTRAGWGCKTGAGHSFRGCRVPLELEMGLSRSWGVSNPLKRASAKSAWSEVKSVLTLNVRPMATWASEALGNWTKERSAFSAALSLAFFFVGPVPSKRCPLTSTLMAKTGACTGPVWDRSLYWRPGLISFSCMSAFFGNMGPGAFLRLLGRNLEWAWPRLPSSSGRLRLDPNGAFLLAVCSPALDVKLSRLRFSLTSVQHEPVTPRESNLQCLRRRIL